MKKVKLSDIKIKIAGFKTEFKPKEKDKKEIKDR